MLIVSTAVILKCKIVKIDAKHALNPKRQVFVTWCHTHNIVVVIAIVIGRLPICIQPHSFSLGSKPVL